jgi:hypothetical protein
MYVIVTGMGSVAHGLPGQWLYLLQLLLAGVAAYGGVMLLVDRSSLREALELVRDRRGNRPVTS